MLSVSEGTEEDFEHDSKLKAYSRHNHMFADLLVPLGDQVSCPILFWLSPANPPGAAVSLIGARVMLIVSLGYPYAFEEVCSGLNQALAEQGVRVRHPWFRKMLEQHGIDPADASFSCLIGDDIVAS